MNLNQLTKYIQKTVYRPVEPKIIYLIFIIFIFCRDHKLRIKLEDLLLFLVLIRLVPGFSFYLSRILHLLWILSLWSLQFYILYYLLALCTLNFCFYTKVTCAKPLAEKKQFSLFSKTMRSIKFPWLTWIKRKARVYKYICFLIIYVIFLLNTDFKINSFWEEDISYILIFYQSI